MLEDSNQTVRPLVPEDLALALDAAPIGIAVADARQPDFPVVFVNRELAVITGYEPQELLGRNLRRLHGPDTDETEVAKMRAAMARGEAVSSELISYRKSGEPFWHRVDLRPIHDAEGEVAAIVGSFRDITEQRQAEERLKQSELRLRAFTGAIPLPMLTVRLDGTILRANEAAEQTLRVPPGSLIGLPVESFAAEEDMETTVCHAIRHQDSVEPRELRARRSDGSEMWVLASARRFSVQADDRYVLVFQDVTELKLREHRLTEANEEAERNIRARMRFLAAASHDLRQPLQAMALFASALDHHVVSVQGRNVVQSLKASLRSMEEMFDSLLDMSKLDAGVMKAETTAFLINDIFEQLEMTYGPQAEAAGLKFTVVPSSAAIHSDPRLLARIVGNFLSNAIRYTRQGRVLLGVRRRGKRLRIAVFDTGPGIPESQRLEIFREFRQGAAAPNVAGRGAGMGLGLAIVQRLSRLLGHALDVRSVEGRGSVFAVEVPLAEDDLPREEDEPEDEEVADVSGLTVVVVDDDRDIQEGLSMLLEEWGCRAVVASNAETALKDLGDAAPDVILADLHLHDRNEGVVAIAAIRQQTGVHAPAFLFTGDTGAPPELDDARVLRKPLDPMRLRMLLGEVRESRG